MKNDFEIRGDKVAIFLNRNDGSILEAIIDKNDFAKVQEFTGVWYASWDKGIKSFYVYGNIKLVEKRTRISLHRYITDCKSGMLVDHINHDTLDNTRTNLRMVTASVNCQNRLMQLNNKSGFRGVSWDKESKKWRSQIKLNNKKYNLGRFDDKNKAAEVVHNARIKLMPGYVYNLIQTETYLEFHESREELQESYNGGYGRSGF